MFDTQKMVAYSDHITPINPSLENHMFQVSPTLMKQCIEMVANEFDYIYPADGIDEDYSVINLGADGVWIVNNLDDSKVQHIVVL